MPPAIQILSWLKNTDYHTQQNDYAIMAEINKGYANAHKVRKGSSLDEIFNESNEMGIQDYSLLVSLQPMVGDTITILEDVVNQDGNVSFVGDFAINEGKNKGKTKVIPYLAVEVRDNKGFGGKEYIPASVLLAPTTPLYKDSRMWHAAITSASTIKDELKALKKGMKFSVDKIFRERLNPYDGAKRLPARYLLTLLK